MAVRRSYTAIVERNQVWRGGFASEPYEAAWAREAIVFVRCLKAEGGSTPVRARVQISPDGMHWCDEGSVLDLPAAADQVAFVKVSHFGGWLRLAGSTPDGAAVTVIVYVNLKE
jgi:hypothetical protein